MAHRTLSSHDRLLADLGLLDRRVQELESGLDDLPAQSRATFDERLTEVKAELGGLKLSAATWEEVEIGSLTRHSVLTKDFDALEADILAAMQPEAPGYELAMDRQIRVWRGRLDDLRVQGVLGSMELRDEVESLGHRLDNVRSSAIVDLQNVLEDSSDLVIDLREDIEEVLVDVRRGLKHAYQAALGH